MEDHQTFLAKAFELSPADAQFMGLGDWQALQARLTRDEVADCDLRAAVAYYRAIAVVPALEKEEPLTKRPRVWVGERLNVDHWWWNGGDGAWVWVNKSNCALRPGDVFLQPFAQKPTSPPGPSKDLLPACSEVDWEIPIQ